MYEAEIKQRVAETAHRCSVQRLQTGDGGNLSARFGDDRMIVLASRSAFCDCTEEDFIVTDLNGRPEQEGRRPSRESLLHGAIYARFPDIMAIVHCHSPFATAWASTMQPLPIATYHSALKLGGRLKVFDTGDYVVTEPEISRIVNSYPSDACVKGFLLRKHGVFAMGESIDLACCTMELIEETATIGILSKLLTLTDTHSDL